MVHQNYFLQVNIPNVSFYYEVYHQNVLTSEDDKNDPHAKNYQDK